MIRPTAENKAFKRAVVSSVIVHVGIFILIIVSPSLPRSSKKEMIHYLPLNMVGLPGGGGSGGGGGGGKPPAAVEVKKETLRDLTTPQKLKEEPKASLRYPIEKPKKEPKKTEKKAVITKQEPTAKKEHQETSGTTEGAGAGFGSGLKIGGIGPGSGTGGGAYDDQIGLSNFPFTYYLQIITDRVSANWFTSLVDPGISGNFQAVIYFKILRNGQILDLTVEQSSGIKSLDMSAQRAVQNSGPFPPLPAEFEGEFLTIHLIFEHSK